MQQVPGWPKRPALKQGFVYLTVALAMLALAPAGLFAQSASMAADNSLSIRDGVVIDATRGSVYMMNAQGGIDAVDLATGGVRWSSADAARPLALAGDVLVAQAPAAASGVLPLVTLDASTGKAAGAAIDVELPQGVWARVKDALGVTFRAQAHLDGEDVLVSWASTRVGGKQYNQGYMPSVEEGASPGGVIPASAATEAARHQGVARVSLTARSATPVAALAERQQARIGLTRGSFLPEVAGAQYLSADGRHVLVSRQVASNSPWGSYRWTIYDRAGARLGEVTGSTSVTPFMVAAGRLVFETRPSMQRTKDGTYLEQPLKLRAVELATGSEIWAREMLNTDYTGPFPP